MENASDKVAKGGSKKAKRVERETPISEHRRELAQQAREQRSKNKIVESYYELVRGSKLLLCKRKESGSVYRVLVGTILEVEPKDANAKAANESLKAHVKKLQAEGELRVRI